MAGKYITKQQAELYMKYRVNEKTSQETSSAKSGFSTRSGYTIEKGQHHSQRPQKKRRAYKTRKSPIDKVWHNELLPMLENNPELQAKTLFIYLQRTYQDSSGEPSYGESVLRTLQRRVSYWLAQYGKPKDVMFPQIHVAGQQGLSDFTHMDRSEILIAGIVLTHMLYHFRLVYSKWSYVKVILSGESFQALTEGLQEALIQLGGSPKEHRTDSLSAAYKNLTEDARTDVTERYEAVCAHYNMEPTRNNKGESHENGSVESSHGHLKNRIAQELILRGSNDFDTLSDYEAWLQDIVLNSNKRNSKNIVIEQQALQPLPEHKTMDYDLLSSKISNLSIVAIKNMTYSLPSRLSGHTLTLHIYQHMIEGYLGGNQVIALGRKYRSTHSSRYVIDYRHIIHALVKKPRAFRYCQYRDEILPTATYRDIWHHLDRTESKDVAPKIMLRLLKLAADHDCEDELGEQVLLQIKENKPIDIKMIEKDFNKHHTPLPTVQCEQHALVDYDQCIPTLNQTAGDVSYATA